MMVVVRRYGFSVYVRVDVLGDVDTTWGVVALLVSLLWTRVV